PSPSLLCPARATPSSYTLSLHDALPIFFLLDPFGLLYRRLPLLTAAGLHHVERVEADHHASGDLERGDRDAEETEDQAAAEGERREGHGARPGPPPGHLTPHLRRVPRRHGEKGRHGGQRIDDEEDRREYQEQVLERLQHALTWSPGSRGPCRPASPRTSPGPPCAAARRSPPRCPRLRRRRCWP